MRRRHLVSTALGFLLGLSAAGGAAAQSSASGPDEAALAKARALFDEASAAYQAGRYDRAVELFLSAYDLSRAPGILFNVAQAYRLRGEAFCDRALVYYRRSLEEDPGADNRPEIEERIAEMERCTREAAGAGKPDAADVAPATRRRPPTGPVSASAALAPDLEARGELAAGETDRARRPVLPIATTIAGGAGLLAGGILYATARVKYEDAQDDCPCEPGTFSTWRTVSTTSYLLLGVGALATATGLVWWWRDARTAGTHRVGVAPAIGGFRWVAEF